MKNLFKKNKDKLPQRVFVLAIALLMSLGVAAQSPGGVAGAALWLKADAGTNTTTNGVAVSSWNDQSGTSNNATQATAANQPLFERSCFSYNPAIWFDGNNDFITTTNNEITNSPYTRFIVYKSNGVTAVTTNYVFTSSPSAAWFRFEIDDTGAANMFHAGGDIASVSSGGLPQYKPYLASIRFQGSGGLANGTTNFIRKNGLDATTSIPAPTGNTSNQKISIGGASGNTDFRGYVSEMISYNSSLSQANYEKVESYLGLKYGISLAHDYTSSTGTTLYNADGSGATYTFDNNIIGIGREGTSSLYQKQTTSIDGGDIIFLSNGALATDNLSNATTMTDATFAVTGNNGVGLTIGVSMPTGVTTANKILNRKWMMQETGTVGAVKIRFDLTGVTGFQTTGKVYLIVADDAAFTTNITQTPAGWIVGGYFDATYDFASNSTKYYTLAWQDGTLIKTIATSTLVPNGDFTNDYASWTSDYTTNNNVENCVRINVVSGLNDFNAPTAPLSPSAGKYIFVNTGQTYASFFKQTISVVPNTAYEVSFYAFDCNYFGGNSGVGAYIDGVKIGETGMMPNSTVFTKYTFKYHAPPGVNSVQFELKADTAASAGGDIKVDDISFTAKMDTSAKVNSIMVNPSTISTNKQNGRLK